MSKFVVKDVEGRKLEVSLTYARGFAELSVVCLEDDEPKQVKLEADVKQEPVQVVEEPAPVEKPALPEKVVKRKGLAAKGA